MIGSELIRRLAFWGIDFLKGSPVRQHIKDLEQAFAVPAKGRELARERLEKFLEHACTTTAFYKKFAGVKNLSDFPVIQKRTIKENYDDFFSLAHDKSDLVTTTTSGSYGTPFTFYLTKEKKSRQWAEVIFFSRWVGYDIGVRHAYVRVTKTKSPLKLFMQNEILMDPTNMDDSWLELQRQKILNDKIKIIIGYPSAISVLADTCRARGDKPEDFSLTAVISCSELLYDSVRQKIETVFGCQVVSRYSTEELGVLAQERTNECKHVINLASYKIELLSLDEDAPSKPGQLGRIVVTDFFSHAMPLIRYDTGDVGVFEPGTSEGNTLPVLQRIEGREIETVYNTAGVRMSPFAVNGTLRDQQDIIQFQFIQEHQKKYTLKLMVLPSFDNHNVVCGRFLDLLGADADFEVEYVSSIPPQPSGKRPYIINKFRKG